MAQELLQVLTFLRQCHGNFGVNDSDFYLFFEEMTEKFITIFFLVAEICCVLRYNYIILADFGINGIRKLRIQDKHNVSGSFGSKNYKAYILACLPPPSFGINFYEISVKKIADFGNNCLISRKHLKLLKCNH